jgi:hypothetical protein
MTLAYALHAIHLKTGLQAPKEVFECASQAQFEELLGLGAVREPSDTEIALFNLANPKQPAPVVAPAPAPKPESAAERKAREKAEADAAAAAAVETLED